MSHTSEPWSVGGSTGLINQVAIEPAVGCCYGAGNELVANVMLVVAAPDMLAALKLIATISEGSTTINSLQHIARLAHVAIQKATGEAA